MTRRAESARSREMREVVERRARGSLSLGEFAQREGLQLETLYRWRRRLKIGAHQLRRRTREPASAAAGVRPGRARSLVPFTEVRAALPSVPATAFEIVLRDGTVVRIPARFEAASLRALLETLRAC